MIDKLVALIHRGRKEFGFRGKGQMNNGRNLIKELSFE